MEAVDQDGDVVDVFLQERRDSQAAKRFFKRLITSNQGKPSDWIIEMLTQLLLLQFLTCQYPGN